MNITIAMQCLIVYIKAKVDFTYFKKNKKRRLLQGKWSEIKDFRLISSVPIP